VESEEGGSVIGPGEGSEERAGGGLVLFRAVVEPLLATFFAIALTLVLTLPFLPTVLEADVQLRPARDAVALPTDEVARRVEDLGLARAVDVVLKRGSDHLVLRDVEDAEGLDGSLLPLLREAGYLEREIVTREVFSFERLLDLDPRTLPALMSIQAVTFLLIGLILTRARVREGPRSRSSPLRAAAAGVGGGVVALLASVVLSRLLEMVGLPVEEQEWLTQLFSDPVALAWLAPWIVLFGPIAEEVFFRRYAFRVISQSAGLPAGLLISSAMFAAIHFNASGFLVYLVIGAVLAWVYERTGRLVAPVVGHVTVNAVVLLVAVLPVVSS
jgi:membrane protease YdiL (CAAX protease family)